MMLKLRNVTPSTVIWITASNCVANATLTSARSNTVSAVVTLLESITTLVSTPPDVRRNLNPGARIFSGQTLIIPQGVTLIVSQEFPIDAGGSIMNYGTIIVNNATGTGTIIINGTITNVLGGTIENSGTIHNNSNTIINSGAMLNQNTGTLNNNGRMVNEGSGVFTNVGIFNNNEAGTLTLNPRSNFDNRGTLNIAIASIFTNEVGATFVNNNGGTLTHGPTPTTPTTPTPT